MADIVAALDFKLQSKICYHRDAELENMDIKAMVDKLIEENKKLRDEKMECLNMVIKVIKEKENLEHHYQVIKQQVAPMEEQLETVNKELAVAKEQLAAAKYERVVANHEKVVSKEELLVAKEQLAQTNEELEVLRKKLQESGAMQTQLQQLKGNGKAPGPEPVHFKREYICKQITRSTYKPEMLPQGPLANDADRNLLKKRKSCPQLLNNICLQESEDMHTQLQQKKRRAPGPQPVHLRRESEFMQIQLQQQKGEAPGPEPVLCRRVTRSIYKREMLLQGPLANAMMLTEIA